jgi:hypothetical protein
MVERFTWQALSAGGAQLRECPFDGFREPTNLGTVFETNEQAASQGCLRLANAFGIDNHWTHYCRWASSQYESGRSDLIREISPSEIVTKLVRDEIEATFYQPVVVEPQPKPRARPPQVCVQEG